jgi:hypothetical protein
MTARKSKSTDYATGKQYIVRSGTSEIIDSAGTDSMLGLDYVVVIARSFASSRYLSAENAESFGYIRDCHNHGCLCGSL